MLHTIKSGWLFVRAALHHWNTHNAQRYAASISYYAVFSLAPMLLIVIVLGGFFLGQAALRGELVSFLSSITGTGSAQLIEQTILSAGISETKIITLIVGIALLLLSAIRAISELGHALDEILIFDPSQNQTGWRYNLHNKVVALIVLVLFALFIIAFLVGQQTIAHLFELFPQIVSGSKVAYSIAIGAFQVGISTIFIVLLYRYIPRITIPWRRLWLGSIITAVLLLVGQYAISAYLTLVPVSSSFGVAGSLIAIMLWVYYSALIFLFGVAITRVYSTIKLGE